MDRSIPGLCPKCHNQNDLKAQYCQICGAPLSDDAKKEQDMYDKMLKDPEFMKILLKKVLQNIEDKEQDENEHNRKFE